MKSILSSSVLLVLVLGAMTPASAQPAPTPFPALDYDTEFFPGTAYDPEIPTLESLLGFRPGDQAARPDEIEMALKAWALASPRAQLVEYARSHEGRALHYMIVTSPENLERLDEVKDGISRLADPRGLSAAEADALIAEQPAIAWMAYSIHGDETSGADGSLALLYHLLAGTTQEVLDLLDEVVVLVDSMENPDGRHRYLQQVVEHRATAPNVDDQSLLHAGYWPWGRTNHYLFDLNRDWILGVNPESRGRIDAAGGWHPQLMVDGHEMGSQDTFLFSPARGPKNPLVPKSLHPWASKFARDQSEAFDRWNWLYYTGEWNEGWYPGYTDAWGQFRGALGILYEQASFTEDGVRQAGGEVVTYREAVHHQAVSSVANLTTLAENREAVLRDYLAERRINVSASGPWADRVFAVLPSANRSRMGGFLDLMKLQGFEVYVIDQETRVGAAVDQYGKRSDATTLPAGTYLISNRQPEAHLVATMLQFDGHMSTDYLERERSSLLKSGRSTIYDVTAWNVTMLYGLESLTLESGLPSGARPLAAMGDLAPTPPDVEAVAWVVDGADDRSVAFAARLLELGVTPRVADRSFELGDAVLGRGSVVVLPADNRSAGETLAATVGSTAADLDLAVVSVETGLGEGDLPDLGGGYFQRLDEPRIALLARGGVNFYDYGSIWHTLDNEMGIRHSQIAEANLNFVDLRRYNVVVLPDRFFGSLDAGAVKALTTWVEAGGTLIAIGGSAGALTDEDAGLSSVRLLEKVLEDLEPYQMSVLRDEMARRKALPEIGDVWSHTVQEGGSFPWESVPEGAAVQPSQLERDDTWARMFMPQGAFLAARTDDEHWLTFGVGSRVPILMRGSSVFMAKQPVEAPVRFGLLEESAAAETRRVGWSLIPEGHDLRLRMSGLLWPEAAGRLANSAFVTRERKGSGQIILFATSPTFRASTRGTARLLMNAMIYGPAFGSNAAVLP